MAIPATDQLKEQLRLERERLSRRQTRRRIRLVLLPLLLAGGLFLLFRLAVGFDVVSGNSMYPSLQDGDVVLYSRLAGAPGHGDIIVFTQDGRDTVKRVAALPGDTVEIDPSSGQVAVNGTPLEEPYVTVGGGTGPGRPQTVLDSYVYVLGDNRKVSLDSRDSSIGTIQMDHILGRVIAVFRAVGPADRLEATQ